MCSLFPIVQDAVVRASYDCSWRARPCMKARRYNMRMHFQFALSASRTRGDGDRDNSLAIEHVETRENAASVTEREA